MSYIRLSKLPLDQELKERIARTSLKTVKEKIQNYTKNWHVYRETDVLSLSPLQVMTLFHMSADECRGFMDHLFTLCVPKHMTALDLSQEEERNSIRLGKNILDTMLHGGLHAGTLTEFAGPSGVGKTQWCLYIAILAVMAKGDGTRSTSAIYIDTETAFRPERIVEIITSKYPEQASKISEYLSKIYVYQPVTIGSLSEIFESLEVVAVEKDVSVVIVDSIASLARKEIMAGSSHSNITRTNQLASWAARLKSIAQQLNICVVVTNQVTTRMVQKEPEVTEEMHSVDGEDYEIQSVSRERKFSRHVTPALGNTWTHCVNTRFILQYTNSEPRQLVIAKSPVAPYATFSYSIGKSGIDIEEHGNFYSYSGSDPGLHKIKVQQGIIV